MIVLSNMPLEHLIYQFAQENPLDDELESLFDEEGLPPCVAMEAWRTAVPVYSWNVSAEALAVNVLTITFDS